jgi:hypothetical protein
MTTLNEIAENIAFKMGEQFNYTLRESIKDTIINYRAKFIRDDSDRNVFNSTHFSQVLTIDFEEVSILDAFGDISCITAICPDITEQLEYKVLRSKELIPIPVRLKTLNISPFIYLGSVDGKKGFIPTTLDSFYYVTDLKYNRKNVYYVYMDNRLYIINNLNQCDINETLKICNVLLKGVFENPREAVKICNIKTNDVDDAYFPIGRDMLVLISNGIIKGEYALITNGKEVNIDSDNVVKNK